MLAGYVKQYNEYNMGDRRFGVIEVALVSSALLSFIYPNYSAFIGK